MKIKKKFFNKIFMGGRIKEAFFIKKLEKKIKKKRKKNISRKNSVQGYKIMNETDLQEK